MTRRGHSTSLLLALIALLAMITLACADMSLETEQEKTLYALGRAIAGNLKSFDLSEAELKVVQAGLADGVLGQPSKVDDEKYQREIPKLQSERAQRLATRNKEAGAAFIEKACGDQGAVRAESGLAMLELEPGMGESPAATDTVKVHYTGTLIDGTVFDSSVERNEPATFGLSQVIPCWTEALQKMRVGGKSRLYCPSDIAYGDRGRPTIPPGSTLVFDVELLEIVR
ncbi:MAG: FKBP-type peptidyl-prolyl cis-trans isomerase [Acidobacteriota bacterium]|nr:MAG: FKBP-type peptidyl-prolyl cis-trans isomerase [Acidobacteriota bacterium]